MDAEKSKNTLGAQKANKINCFSIKASIIILSMPGFEARSREPHTHACTHAHSERCLKASQEGKEVARLATLSLQEGERGDPKEKCAARLQGQQGSG